MLYRLAFLFVLITGFTGLVYQVTWHKYLSFYLGSHAMAAALVLAVFFLFLSLGYAVLGRNIHRIPISNKLFVYGIIEALIGFYALVSPQIFHWLVEILPAGGQSQAGDFVLGFFFTTAYIGIPTFLMGTTIPVLTQALSRDFDTSHGTHAAVYGLNTLGAVFGALLAGFVLIDIWGLPLTLLNTGLLNIAVGLATYAIWKARPQAFAGMQPEQERVEEPEIRRQQQPQAGQQAEPQAISAAATQASAGWVLVLYAVSFASGFYVFSLENLMIRVAGLVIGSSGYTFSMIVAAFILGIALGSLWVGRRRVASPRFFLGVQVALLVTATMLYLLVPELPDWFARVRVMFANSYINIPWYWTAVFTLFAAILLIPVALMGMNLPLIFNYLRSRGLFLSQTVGRIYAINTLGSVLGSLVGGYFLFFWLTWDGVFRFNLLLIAATVALVAWLAASGRLRVFGLGATALAVLVVILLPRWDDNRFVPAAYHLAAAPRDARSLAPELERFRDGAELIFSYHGPAAHVAALQTDSGIPSLIINGNPNTGVGDYTVRAMNAIYPLSFKRAPERAFVVGLGGGLSSSVFAEHPDIDEVVVAEIAIGAIEALPLFDIQNDDFTQRDFYDKVRFVPADAIKVLRSDPEPFDIIVSEPNHPWVAGVENLFSIEFLSLVRDQLTDDGVYCQWFPMFGSDVGTMLTILNTFNEVFPHVRAFSVGGGALSIVAGKQPLQADPDHLQWMNEQFAHRFSEDNFAETRFAEPYFLLATELINPWALRELVDEFEVVQSFEFPVIAKAAAQARFAMVGSQYHTDLAPRLHRGPVPGEPGARMLYEDIRPVLQPEWFDTAWAFYEASATHSRNRFRLWNHYLDWFDAAPDWLDEQSQRVLRYLTDRDDEFPEHLRDADAQIGDAVDSLEPSAEVVEQPATASGGVAGPVDGTGPVDGPAAGIGVGTGAGTTETSPAPDEQTLELAQTSIASTLLVVYRQLIQAQVPAVFERVLREVPDQCSTFQCSRLKQEVLWTALAGNKQAEQLRELNVGREENRARVDAALQERVRAGM